MHLFNERSPVPVHHLVDEPKLLGAIGAQGKAVFRKFYRTIPANPLGSK